MYSIILRDTFFLLLLISSLSVVAAPLDCDSQSPSVRATCNAIEAKRIKLEQLKNLLKTRFVYIDNIIKEVETFCDVEKRLTQNERAIDRLVQGILPFDCTDGADTIGVACQFIKGEYRNLNSLRAGLDQEMAKLHRSCTGADDEPKPISPRVDESDDGESPSPSSVFVPKGCTAADTFSTFVYDGDGSIVRHQAQSLVGSDFNKTKFALKAPASDDQYYLKLVPQKWLSPYVFVVGEPYDDNNLLFQVYCRSDFSLIDNQTIRADNIEVSEEIYASYGHEAFALSIAPKSVLVWTSNHKHVAIITTKGVVLAMSLGIDEESGDLRLTYLDQAGNIVSQDVESQSVLFSAKIDASLVKTNIGSLKLIDENNLIYVLTAQRGYLFLPDRAQKKSLLYNLSDDQGLKGMAFFLYKENQDSSSDFGLGFITCDKTKAPYEISFRRISGSGQIKGRDSFPLDDQWLGSAVSCDDLGDVQFFVRSNDSDGESFSFILVWNHPANKGQVSMLNAEKDFFSDQWQFTLVDNIDLNDTIDPLYVRVVGDFGSVARIYHFFNKKAAFNIGFDK